MTHTQIQCCGYWIDYPTPGQAVTCPGCGSVFLTRGRPTTDDGMHQLTRAQDYAHMVEALPSDTATDLAVASAQENAYDRGLREDAPDDGAAYWRAVYEEITS